MQKKNDTYMTRETLVKKLSQDRGSQAWEEFVPLYERFIFSIIRKMGLSVPDSQDLLQTVLIKIWENIPSFELSQRKGAFRGWIGIITRRTTYNFIKKNEAINRRDKSAAFHHEDFMGKDESLDEVIEQEWKRNIVHLAFKNVSGKVSEQMIDIFQACSKGESAASLSARLNIPIRSIYRYRQKVEQLLTDEINALKEMLE